MNTETDVLFISHGGGPMPLLGDPGHREMVERLTEIANRLRKPSAILVISAHWEESVPTITAGANPQLIYDYYGFSPEAYTIEYPCPVSWRWLARSARRWRNRGSRRGLMIKGASITACSCRSS